MKQYEAVMKVMRRNGGFSTLGFLYQEVPKIQDVQWKTKTPFASIRRIVQDSRFFFKIRPGLWALNESRGKLPNDVAARTVTAEKESAHTYYQGLLVELGNLQQYETAVPSQDKNKHFLGKRLAEITTVSRTPPFSYDRFVRCAGTIDVIWINDRQMPASFFEVEHSTNIRNSLCKFVELQDFAANFIIVADRCRKRDFENKREAAAFKPVAERIRFMDYDAVSQFHAMAAMNKDLRFI